MEKWPTGVHEYIFELACTDGGAAGIALSVVSRYRTNGGCGENATRRAHPLALARTALRCRLKRYRFP
jgi:hypothetical protein